jgi:hypothetical protein
VRDVSTTCIGIQSKKLPIKKLVNKKDFSRDKNIPFLSNSLRYLAHMPRLSKNSSFLSYGLFFIDIVRISSFP